MGSMVLALFVGLAAVFSSPPVVSQQIPELPYVIESVSTYTELEAGESVRLLISVHGRIDTDTDDILRPHPVEIRLLKGRSVMRPTFRLVERNTFEAWVAFQQPGEWQLVLYPDVPEIQREWLPRAIPTETSFLVKSGPTDWLGVALILLLAAGLFAYGMDRRKQGDPPQRELPPMTGGDTW